MDHQCQCCIVGVGPASMLLALLLARKGVSVKLLEMHADLNRDFRGDTVHASTLEILDHLAEVQKRRMKPTSTIQCIQGVMQKNIVAMALKNLEFELPLIAKIILKIPGLRDIPPRTMALGLSRVRIENP